MSVAIIVLPILILLVLALGVLVYYICYKAAINRKLRSEESNAHVPMASMETVWKIVAVIAVLVMYASLNSKIVSLQEELTDARITMTDEIAAMQYEIYEIRENVKKEASMIRGAYYEFEEFDPKEQQVKVSFQVIPKSYSADTKLSVDFRKKRAVLTNQGDGVFTGSETFSLYDDVWEEGMFFVTEGGVTKTEPWEDVPMGRLLFDCLPQLCVTYSTFGYGEFGFGNRGDKLSVDGELRVEASEQTASAFRDMKFCVKKGNHVIDELPMEDGYRKFGLSYPVEKSDSITLYVTATDEYGYRHELLVGSWHGKDADGSEEWNGYRIYTPEGTLLTQ